MKIKIALLLLCCLILSGCGYYRTITGTVVDAETLKPIEGAVVMAEWTGHKGMPGMAYTVSLKVVEAVTDKNGIVQIEGISDMSAEAPTLAIYKPGYVIWSSRSTWPVHSYRDFRWQDQTFKLERFKPEYSYDKHESFFHGAINYGMGSKKIITGTYDEWEANKAFEERNMKRSRGSVK